jgi:hypothetical protein
MTHSESPNVDEERESSRSDGLLFPGFGSPGQTAVVWYACPDAACGYRERGRPDGTLRNEFCPVDGALLVRELPRPETS